MSTLAELQQGFDTITGLLARTLGPASGPVVNAVSRQSVELLSDSPTIARRITSLPGRGRNSGAAIARDLVRRVGERHGDGGATAAVLARAMLRESRRSVVAGANPVLVRRGLLAGVRVAGDALKHQAAAVEGESALAGLAAAASGDPELSRVLGEVLDVIGDVGALEIRRDVSARSDSRILYDYVDGARWRARPASPDLVPEGMTEATLVEPVVALADEEIRSAADVLPLLEVAQRLPERPPLLLVAPAIGEEALQTLRMNSARGTLVSAPVVLTTARLQMHEDLDDLARLTGAQVCSAETGRPLRSVRADDLGRVRRAFVERGQLMLTGGYGDDDAVQERAAQLRAHAWERHAADGSTDIQRVWLRQARLLGRVAVVRVAARTEAELEIRTETAKRLDRLLRAALWGGVVPGGGVGFLACVPDLLAEGARLEEPEVALGMAAVRAALEAPFLQIVRNGGQDHPRVALDTVRRQGDGYGLDVLTNRYVDMREQGIFDVAAVAAGALAAAGETAAVLISAGVVAGRA
jgi:chaperonin GroEL